MAFNELRLQQCFLALETVNVDVEGQLNFRLFFFTLTVVSISFRLALQVKGHSLGTNPIHS